MVQAACFCSQCPPGVLRNSRTTQSHLSHDQKCLESLENCPDVQDSDHQAIADNHMQFLLLCIQKTAQSLDDIDVGTPDEQDMDPARISLQDPTPNQLDGEEDCDGSWDGEEEVEIMGFSASDDGTDEEPQSELDSGDESPSTVDTFPIPDTMPNTFFSRPLCVSRIQDDLLGGYTPPEHPPSAPFSIDPLTDSELLSLQHYMAWRRSNGTVRAYNEHRSVLQNATGADILSLGLARKLAARVCRLYPQTYDMCWKSCIAYTGQYTNLTSCPYIPSKSKEACGEPRYHAARTRSGKLKAVAQFKSLPLLATLEAIFANADTSRLVRERDSRLKQILSLVARTRKEDLRKLPQYSDFNDSQIHRLHHRKMGMFTDERDIAFALSSDGAQLTMKKQSNTWILILILLNLPAELRCKTRHVIVNFVTPGPNSPGDIESFMRPLFEELARLGEGVWIWDAIDSSYFMLRGYATMILGDMLGSAKMNGMAGHSAVFGDRFSMVQGARSSTKSGSKAQYYPIEPPENDTYNPTRPKSYNLSQLPRRNQIEYFATLARLSVATTKNARALISKETGISRIPLCVGSKAFIHPVYFPLDPFHLFYENCAPFIWDIWTVLSKPGESIHIPQTKIQRFGELVALAVKTLPPKFCGPIRDPHLKRQSQYKAYEWMALVHWYILPIGLELEFDFAVLENFANFVLAVEIAMTLQKHSEESLELLEETIHAFLSKYKFLYVSNDPEKIQRCRLCIFQLVHVPMHIRWFGSIRNGSQATVEREIGISEHQIHSKKEPFQNLVNIVVDKEIIRIIELYYPALAATSPDPATVNQTKLVQHVYLKVSEREGLNDHFIAIRAALGLDPNADLSEWEIKRYGKFQIRSGETLRSKLSESQRLDSYNIGRLYRWFEASTSIQRPQTAGHKFGEAHAFYSLKKGREQKSFVVYTPLLEISTPLKTVIRGKWPSSHTVFAMETEKIKTLVGIWEAESRNVYVLRKHPGLEMLQPSQCGLQGEMEQEFDEDDL